MSDFEWNKAIQKMTNSKETELKMFDPDTILLVTWIDSIGCNGAWTEFGDLDNDIAMICTSVGYPLKETREYLILVPHIHGDLDMEGLNKRVKPSGCGEMTIPKVSIRSVTPLCVDATKTQPPEQDQQS